MNRNGARLVVAVFLIVVGIGIMATSERPSSCKMVVKAKTVCQRMARGRILGAGREVLAEDEAEWSVRLDPQAQGTRTNVWSDARVAEVVADGLGLGKPEVLSKLRIRDNRYIPLKVTRDPDEISSLKRFGRRLRLVVEERIARRYPLGRAACHVVGYCSPSESVREVPAGGGGFESSEDEWLRLGHDVSMDIVPEMQLELYAVITNAVKMTGAAFASGVILSARLENVLAMVSFPDFDPIEFARADEESRINRCIEVVEPVGGLIRPLLSPTITNDVRQVHARLSYLGFGHKPEAACWNSGASGRLLSPEAWTPRYHRRILSGTMLRASTLQIATAFARAVAEENPVPRAMTSVYYEDLETGSTTNTVNHLEITTASAVTVITLKRPASNAGCREFLRAMSPLSSTTNFVERRKW